MQHRAFGHSGSIVSEVGVGTWQFGGEWGSQLSDETAWQTLAAAVDAGVTFFDTADIYVRWQERATDWTIPQRLGPEEYLRGHEARPRPGAGLARQLHRSRGPAACPEFATPHTG